MKRSVLTLASISTLALGLAACGGGGSGSGTGVNPQPPAPIQTTSPTSKATASVNVSFVVPVATGHANPSSSKRQTKSLSSRKPLYISPDTAGFFFFMDGQAIFGTPSSGTTPNTAASLTPNTYTSSASIPGGGTAKYTVTQQSGTGTGCTVTTCNNPYTYDTITASLNVLPGLHKFGVVLAAADGFVLSEDQESQTLNGGTNTPATFYLKGVVDSAFWCDAACDGGTGPANSDGSYTLAVFGTDHEGDAIPYQTVGGIPITVDNGTLNLVETDSDAIVSITTTPTGPLTNPGNANVVTYTEAGQATISSGWTATVKCLKVGSTTVALQVGPTSTGGVSGFNYGANIDPSKDPVDPNAPTYNPFTTPTTPVYTSASQDVGTVPVQQDFGNELQVNCDASLGITFM
jgi:hypothetical protein